MAIGFVSPINERVAWVSRTVIDDTVDGIDDLPTLTDDLETPMQAFYLRTGIGQTTCEDVPEDTLLVQGPENIEINITANGADIEIGSTLGLRIIIIDGQPFLQAIAFAGEIHFMGVRLRPGQYSLACLGEEDNRGQDGNDNDLVVTCDASPAEAFEDFGELWCSLEQLPANLLNYQINILCPGETPIVTNSGGGGATTSNVPGVDCSSFRLISPLGPVNSGDQIFSWTAVESANGRYQLVFWNFAGEEVESFFTTETSYRVNLGSQTSTGGEFSYEVRFYEGDQYVCVTFRSPTLVRTGELNVPVVGGGFTASHSACFDNGSTYETTVSWSNAPSTPVLIEWQDTLNPPQMASAGAATGSLNIQSSFSAYTFVYIRVSAGGETINLGAC